jgi:hypothetical protein
VSSDTSSRSTGKKRFGGTLVRKAWADDAMPASIALTYRVQESSTASRLDPNDFYIKMNQAIALSAGLIEASRPLTSTAGLGGLNR